MQTTTAILDRLENQYVKSASKVNQQGQSSSKSKAGCTNLYTDSSTSHAPDPQIQLHQVLGLWYILLITFGLATIIVTMQLLIHRRKQVRGWISSVTGSRSGKVVAEDVTLGTGDVASASGGDDTAEGKDDCCAEIVRTASVAKKQGVAGSSGQLSAGQPRQAAGLPTAEQTLVQRYDA